MSPPSTELSELYRIIAVWGVGVIGLLITTIAMIFNNRQNRLSSILEQAVDQESFDRRLQEISAQRIAFHEENTRKLDEINKTTQVIAAQAVELGRIDIRIEMLEKREAIMGKWKHEVVDPYIPGEINNLKHRVEALEVIVNRSGAR